MVFRLIQGWLSCCETDATTIVVRESGAVGFVGRAMLMMVGGVHCVYDPRR